VWYHADPVQGIPPSTREGEQNRLLSARGDLEALTETPLSFILLHILFWV